MSPTVCTHINAHTKGFRERAYCCSNILIPETHFYVVSWDMVHKKEIDEKTVRQSVRAKRAAQEGIHIARFKLFLCLLDSTTKGF